MRNVLLTDLWSCAAISEDDLGIPCVCWKSYSMNCTNIYSINVFTLFFSTVSTLHKVLYNAFVPVVNVLQLVGLFSMIVCSHKYGKKQVEQKEQLPWVGLYLQTNICSVELYFLFPRSKASHCVFSFKCNQPRKHLVNEYVRYRPDALTSAVAG